jgi:phosphoglycerate dehydrogenase-like enzyme
MKPGACLVDVARAQIVDRDALISALRSRQLSGFALDLLYEEPGRDDDEVLTFNNVIVTPHIAAQPRFNAPNDFADVVGGIYRALA